MKGIKELADNGILIKKIRQECLSPLKEEVFSIQ